MASASFIRCTAFLPLLFIIGCSGGRNSFTASKPSSDPVWARIDSLDAIGQHASALALTEQVRTEAMSKADWRTEFRAWMYRSRQLRQTGADPSQVIADLEQRVRNLTDTTLKPLTPEEVDQGVLPREDKGHVPLRQLLHSALGEAYWQYYQDQRWRILERTVVEDNASGDDLGTWDQRQFMQRIIAHYTASLKPLDTLARLPAAELRELLEGPDVRDPRDKQGAWFSRSGALEEPMLFDVLARRALLVFTNSETRSAEPAWRFRLDDASFFDLFEHFAYRPLRHRDSTAWEFIALRTYQQLERSHLADDEPVALTDALLERLAFVRRHSTLGNADSLYEQALITLRSRIERLPAWSEVTVALANVHAERALNYRRLEGDEWRQEKRIARDLCNEAIDRHPGSFGARNAAALKARLEEPFLALHVEQAVIPGSPFRVALRYANARTVWLRVVTTPLDENDEARVGTWQDVWRDRDEKVVAQRPLREWRMDLPDDGDLNEHSIELPVQGLPPGHYTLIICDSEAFRKGMDRIAAASFWSTNLAMADRSSGSELDLLVVDRATGAPKEGVKAWAYVRNRGYTGIDRFIGVEQFTTDENGLVRTNLKGEQGQLLWSLSDGRDRYISDKHWVHAVQDGAVTDTLRTFLFTDRAIYRPGQTILFKGIVTVRRGGGTVVNPGHATSITVFDVNGQMVDSIRVATDAFGAFHGSTKAPPGLTGGMRISAVNGDTWVTVEEYKRPTFEVVFDTLAAAPKLGQEVTLSGTARSYAGVSLDGAEVRWVVRRSARFPWWSRGWWDMPSFGQSTEVASGVANTEADGRFTVHFNAFPDPVVSPRYDPSFVFELEASATDLNGETQLANTTITVGTRGIEVEPVIGEAIERSSVKELRIAVRNLNGGTVDLPMFVRIEKLNDPEGVPEPERLWEPPDRWLPGEQAAEVDPLRTPAASVLLERSAWSSLEPVPLEGVGAWPLGRYRIVVNVREADGRELEVRKLFTVFDRSGDRSGFMSEAFHVEPVVVRTEPGTEAQLLLSTALPEAHVWMDVERGGRITEGRWIELGKGQRIVTFKVDEADRGGFAVHLFHVAQGRSDRITQLVEVPWNNKELGVEWMTFRDKMVPGAKEEWRLRITGPGKEQVSAQVLALMYDASLDHFVPHGLSFHQWPRYSPRRGWSNAQPFGPREGWRMFRSSDLPGDTVRMRNTLRTFGFLNGYNDVVFYQYAPMRGDVRMEDGEGFFALSLADSAGEALPAKPKAAQGPTGLLQAPVQPVRTDFRETAFFLPDLLTDRDGQVVLKFTMPEAMTRWRLLGLAHTTDLEQALFEKRAVTSKALMVIPNLPRFLRQGDRIEVTAKINVLEGGMVTGSARLELFDPRTGSAIATAFGLRDGARTFKAGPGQSAVANWVLHVPSDQELVAVRITASAAGFSDGEERVLPVLTDRMLVTESLPLQVTKAGTRAFTLEKLKNANSTTLVHKGLVLEFTPDPAWYAVQALPYLMEFPHECAEQIFARYYANALAASIVRKRPAVRQVFEAWAKAGPQAFLSALERNADLKAIVLEETPWVLDARDDRERRQRVALLFDLERMAQEERSALRKLRELQLPDGAWPWFGGMQASRQITQYIVSGLGHLEQLGAADLRPDGEVQVMLRRAVRWLDEELERDHRRVMEDLSAEQRSLFRPGSEVIQALYARSFFRRWPIDGSTAAAVHFFRDRLAAVWLEHGLQEQAMLALIFKRFDTALADQVLRSLKERATVSAELGMYWKGFARGMDWWAFPTETHALMIEAFHEVMKDRESVNALRQHLLTLKRTTDWGTTKATAEACYALLLTGDEWLGQKEAPVITMGGKEVRITQQEAGSGYFRQNWSGAEVKPGMGEVSVTTRADGVQWGALHWQYMEHMDKVTTHEGPFSISRQVMLRQPSEAGQRLVPLDGAARLRPGDRISVRIGLRTDRYLDHVHLKDLRAAGLEPVEALSGYRYQGGLGYYQSIRDAAMHFFFDRVAPGTYVFEYDLKVTHAGEFSNGISTAQCMYAPEFSSHSPGLRITVGGR